MPKEMDPTATRPPGGGTIIGGFIVCGAQANCNRRQVGGGPNIRCVGNCSADPNDPCACAMVRRERRVGAPWEIVEGGTAPAGVPEAPGYDYYCVCMRPHP
jgi:hypothetical protein